jgi:hypothetical protein
MPLDPFDLLARIVTASAAGSSRFDGLAVDTAGAGFGVFPSRLPDSTAERVMDLLPDPATTPLVKIVPDCSLGREIMR